MKSFLVTSLVCLFSLNSFAQTGGDGPSNSSVNDCDILVVEQNNYNGPRISRSSFGGSDFSEGPQTREKINLFKALTDKGYYPSSTNKKAALKLTIAQDYSLYGLSAWFTYDFTMSENDRIIAMASGKANAFTPDFIAENTGTFRKMKGRAHAKALDEILETLNDCR